MEVPSGCPRRYNCYRCWPNFHCWRRRHFRCCCHCWCSPTGGAADDDGGAGDDGTVDDRWHRQRGPNRWLRSDDVDRRLQELLPRILLGSGMTVGTIRGMRGAGAVLPGGGWWKRARRSWWLLHSYSPTGTRSRCRPASAGTRYSAAKDYSGCSRSKRTAPAKRDFPLQRFHRSVKSKAAVPVGVCEFAAANHRRCWTPVETRRLIPGGVW